MEPPLRRLGFICLLAASLATPALVATEALADPALVSLGVGGTDFLNQATRAAGDVRLEYRSGLSLLPFFEDYFKIKPWAGLEVTTRDSIWGGGGIVLEIPIGKHFVLTPNFGAGAFSYGRGKDLGSVVEFRSTFEGGYVFDNGTRLVASFGHTSNAGLTKRNPGEEQAMVTFQIPISSMVSAIRP